MKEFNTTGICNPEKHYMVDISERLKKIKVLVDGESISASIEPGNMERLQRLVRWGNICLRNMKS